METITKFNVLTKTKGFPIDCKYHKSMEASAELSIRLSEDSEEESSKL